MSLSSSPRKLRSCGAQFFHNLGLVDGARNFCHTAHFRRKFCSKLPVGRKGLTTNGQRDDCYPDGETRSRHPLTPVCGLSVTRSLLHKEAVQYFPWKW